MEDALDAESNNDALQETAIARNDKQSRANASDHEQLHAVASKPNSSQGPVLSEEAPTDDIYVFTIKSAATYAAKKGALIPERTIYDNCQHGRQRNTLKCWQSSVGDSLLLVGRNSFDRFIQKRLENDALRSHDQPPTSDTASEDEAFRKQGREHEKITMLEKEVLDLQTENDGLNIAGKAKDMVIAEFKKAREKDQKLLMTQSHRIGVLETETKFLQLQGPGEPSQGNPPRKIESIESEESANGDQEH